MPTFGQEMAAGQFGAVVTANRLRSAALRDNFVEHACDSTAGKASIDLQR